MDYRPVTAVWEITMGCNMRCKHCGSSCTNPLEGELTTDEALKLCDDLGQLGFQWITISGGEPTTRKDWHLIAGRLRENKIIPTMITNGWLLDESMIEKGIAAQVNTIAFSIDGLAETHDLIRKQGSFQRIMHALDLLKQQSQISVSAITTLNKQNIPQLKTLKEILIEKNVRAWQVQIGLPMGNMTAFHKMIMEPEQVDEIINFAYETNQEGRIEIQPADCIGYFNVKEIELRKNDLKLDDYHWQGCPAGKFSMGILHNGDITGCTSIRDPQYIAGNIRRTPLKGIWENPKSFSWNRNFSKEQLTGFCGKCQYGRICLGGCANTRLTMSNSFNAENKYCSYHQAIDKAKKALENVATADLAAKAGMFAKRGSFQLAELLLARALSRDPRNIELLNLYGYVSFKLNNFTDAQKANQAVLELDPNNAYAHKGMGLTLSRLGKVEEGIAFLQKAVALADDDFLDPYYDLALILYENQRKEEARRVLEEGRKKSAGFIETSRDLYRLLA
jgi:radical SAM protein with 4Fe4S-binding SPASM domain